MGWADEGMPRDIRAYHRRTKHAVHRYALGPAFLDWTSQPNPFRRFDGARTVPLPLSPDRPTPPFRDLARLDGVAAEPLSAAALGLFLELALGISAWKAVDGAQWAVRNNPSSGNLHPTEGYVILPPLDGIGDGPALYHYAPADHALEERCRLDRFPALPTGGFIVGLSSVAWREAWKYGERAFRYCQHDVGHAVGALSYAAACLGWRVTVQARHGDAAVGRVLGLDRADAWHRHEQEHPDLLAVVAPEPVEVVALGGLSGGWTGTANRLSEDHDPWPAVDLAARYSYKTDNPPIPADDGAVAAPDLPAADTPAAAVIRRRRSAVRMDGRTPLDRTAFFRILSATLPDRTVIPWSGFSWPPRLALFLFVHRVTGVEPGLYALIRDPASLDRLRAACDPSFLWQPVAECPLPLFLLRADAVERNAAQLSCLQAIAGKGAFSLGMAADFDRTLRDEGDWAYRRLFWEAGLVGQVLYVEATAAGTSGTGLGCFFDDGVHDLLGLTAETQESMAWQSLYHFTVGTALEDERVLTLPAYPPER